MKQFWAPFGFLAILTLMLSGVVAPATEGPLQFDSPVTVKNGDRELTFSSPPNRVVTMNHNATELFLALGLQNRMVGTAWKDHAILHRFRDEYQSIPVLSEKYPSLEVLLEAQPDFVYGWSSAFEPPEGPATVDRLEALGITPYVDRMYLETRVTLKDVYREIQKIGTIFGVEKRSRDLAASLRRNIKRLTAQVPDHKNPLRVAVYNYGTEAFYGAGPTLITDLLRAVNARNVLADDLDKVFGRVSWETIVAENPEYIVIVDHGTISAEQKKENLIEQPGLSDVKAIREQNFVVLPLATTYIGVRVVRAVEQLARGFYPNHVQSDPRPLTGSEP